MFAVHRKDTNKRARNTKLASVFFIEHVEFTAANRHTIQSRLAIHIKESKKKENAGKVMSAATKKQKPYLPDGLFSLSLR